MAKMMLKMVHSIIHSIKYKQSLELLHPYFKNVRRVFPSDHTNLTYFLFYRNIVIVRMLASKCE